MAQTQHVQRNGDREVRDREIDQGGDADTGEDTQVGREVEDRDASRASYGEAVAKELGRAIIGSRRWLKAGLFAQNPGWTGAREPNFSSFHEWHTHPADVKR